MDALALFILWALFGCNRNGGGGYAPPLPPSTPGGQPGWPGSPIDLLIPEVLPTSTPPWPQVLPPDLPRFPGSGWEFDEPPPPAVQQRAGQLVDTLWKQGNGASKIEQTAGRWIAYQAQIVASGKKGVVAYRVKNTAALPPGSVASRSTRQRPRAVPAATPARATAPTPTPVAPQPSAPARAPAVSPLVLPTLRRGMGIKPEAPNADVRLLQQRLGIQADGQFGKDTEAAVRAYQLRKGLKVDGVVGEKTWAALFAVAA